MNDMIDAVLESFAAALRTAAPGREVTRTWKDFADRPKDQLARGVYTIILRGQRESVPYKDYVQAFLIGQCELGEGAQGVDVERAELKMLGEIRELIRGIKGAKVAIEMVEHSMQLEAPLCWVKININLGPFDLQEAPTGLGSFITYNHDTDLAPKDAVVDANDLVTLPQ